MTKKLTLEEIEALIDSKFEIQNELIKKIFNEIEEQDQVLNLIIQRMNRHEK